MRRINHAILDHHHVRIGDERERLVTALLVMIKILIWGNFPRAFASSAVITPRAAGISTPSPPRAKLGLELMHTQRHISQCCG